MNKTRLIEWFEMENGTSIGFFPLQQTPSDDYLCPQCGKPTQYSEGQIDELPNGAEVRGWWFACWDCHIDTEATEGGWNGDDQ